MALPRVKYYLAFTLGLLKEVFTPVLLGRTNSLLGLQNAKYMNLDNDSY